MTGPYLEPQWRTAARGRCYTYVIPCREADLLKVGLSRDPLARFRTLHARYFEFFDLERGALVEMDHVRDARRLESRLKELFADRRAVAPLVVPDSAAGYTEWYRGVYPEALAVLEAARAADGYRIHAPLRSWLRDRLDHDDALFEWSLQTLKLIEFYHFNAGGEPRPVHDRSLRNVLDAYEAVGLALDERVPASVLQWYRYGFGPD
jgi:Meiotically Up-regulated Gene 113 (MUG113) protein